jgi:hypothetical protein
MDGNRGNLEPDWKLFRQLHTVALERFCQRVLEEIERVNSDTTKTHHQRYLAMWRLIKKRDRELADAFNDMRRSTFVRYIALIKSYGLWSEEEFARFSPQIRGAVDSLLGNDRT